MLPSTPAGENHASSDDGNVGRRSFLKRLSAVGALVSGALVSVPVLRAIFAPTSQRAAASSWVKVADDTALLDIGVPIRVNFVQSVDDAWIESRTLSGVWLYTEDGEKFKAYNGHCTHLGCSYFYDKDKKSFVCPCHHGQFDVKTGKVLAGPVSPRFSLDGSITNERFLTRLESQYRATGQLNNPTYNWVANNQDEIRTVSAGFRASLIPDHLEAGGRVDASRAKFRMATFNPLTPAGGTAAQNFAATASDLPEVTQKYQPMTLYATYLLTPEWGMTFRWQTERWSQNDFRTLGLQPAEGNGIFLGNNLNDYDARYFTISVSYRPRLLRIPRPAL